MLPTDLKNYREDAFQILTEEEAGLVLAVILALCLILDRLGVWA